MPGGLRPDKADGRQTICKRSALHSRWEWCRHVCREPGEKAALNAGMRPWQECTLLKKQLNFRFNSLILRYSLSAREHSKLNHPENGRPTGRRAPAAGVSDDPGSVRRQSRRLRSTIAAHYGLIGSVSVCTSGQQPTIHSSSVCDSKERQSIT